jgi:adenylosuccinate lyase
MIHQSLIYQDYFGTAPMRGIWNEAMMVQRWLDFEAAVASAEGELGIIPKDAARRIARCCTTETVTPAAVAAWRARTGHVIVALTRAFCDACPKAGELFHFGPTTQDVLDTGITLQIRDSLRLVLPALVSLADLLFDKALRYRDLPQMGRTEGQHASPITFGYKLAVLASEIADHVDRLVECSKRLLILTMFGATGVQSSYTALAGKIGVQRLARLVSRKLGLAIPPVCPHHRTDRFAELGSVLSLVLSTLGEAGLEIRDLQRTEVSEVSEPWGDEQHSSSTMPQKQNPETSEWLEGLALLGRAHATALAGIRQQHERDITRLAPELVAVPNLFLYTMASIDSATRIYQGLVVKPEAMRRNLHAGGGLAMAESVMLTLSQKSKKKAWSHQLCHDIAMRTAASNGSFQEALERDPQVSAYMTSVDIANALTPERYIGTGPLQASAAASLWAHRRAKISIKATGFGINIPNRKS